MTAKYQEIRDRSMRAVDAVMAETVRLLPLVKGIQDRDRQAVEFNAVLRTGGAKNTSLNGGVSRDWVSRITAGKAQLHVDRTAYPLVVVRRGDKLRAIERAGQPWFEVLDIDDRSHTRLVIDLGEA